MWPEVYATVYIDVADKQELHNGWCLTCCALDSDVITVEAGYYCRTCMTLYVYLPVDELVGA